MTRTPTRGPAPTRAATPACPHAAHAARGTAPRPQRAPALRASLAGCSHPELPRAPKHRPHTAACYCSRSAHRGEPGRSRAMAPAPQASPSVRASLARCSHPGSPRAPKHRPHTAACCHSPSAHRGEPGCSHQELPRAPKHQPHAATRCCSPSAHLGEPGRSRAMAPAPQASPSLRASRAGCSHRALPLVPKHQPHTAACCYSPSAHLAEPSRSRPTRNAAQPQPAPVPCDNLSVGAYQASPSARRAERSYSCPASARDQLLVSPGIAELPPELPLPTEGRP
ncbi:hypothetical protein ABH935_004793 [Catenulispora sp. GAS73]